MYWNAHACACARNYVAIVNFVTTCAPEPKSKYGFCFDFAIVHFIAKV
jgi:hypothetical protein